MKLKYLVTGANGQLGNEIRRRAAQCSHELVFTDIDEADLSDANTATSLLDKIKPDGIINCAAYTAVDKAETEREQAAKVNEGIPRNITEWAGRHNARIIHLSTDYVFSGYAPRPVTEADEPSPASYYGVTKLRGEEIVQKHPLAMTIRTSWLYSSFGHNFVKTMLGLMKQKEEISVVFDQVGSPTYAGDLAAAILEIIGSGQDFVPGIFHYANEGVASWYDLAMEIKKYTGSACKIIPIETKDYPTPAPRPWYSVLNKQKIKKQFGLDIPYWKESLYLCLEEINNAE